VFGYSLYVKISELFLTHKFKFNFFFVDLLTDVDPMTNIVPMKRILMAIAIVFTTTLASCGSGAESRTDVLNDTTSVDSTNANTRTMDSVQ
jgi:hypothetical protein